ncbi:hypothetical protein Godav_022838 [Gossypium davidsonii]|nr:hypothetical protein [Gossypium davidsonii]
METREMTRKTSRSRDMLLALEERVVNLKDSLGDVKETLKEVKRRIVELDLKEEQLKEVVLESLSSNMKEMYRMSIPPSKS